MRPLHLTRHLTRHAKHVKTAQISHRQKKERLHDQEIPEAHSIEPVPLGLQAILPRFVLILKKEGKSERHQKNTLKETPGIFNITSCPSPMLCPAPLSCDALLLPDAMPCLLLTLYLAPLCHYALPISNAMPCIFLTLCPASLNDHVLPLWINRAHCRIRYRRESDVGQTLSERHWGLKRSQCHTLQSSPTAGLSCARSISLSLRMRIEGYSLLRPKNFPNDSTCFCSEHILDLGTLPHMERQNSRRICANNFTVNARVLADILWSISKIQADKHKKERRLQENWIQAHLYT